MRRGGRTAAGVVAMVTVLAGLPGAAFAQDADTPSAGAREAPAEAVPAPGDRPEVVAGELLVRFRPGASAEQRANARDRNGVEKVRDVALAHTELVRIVDGNADEAGTANRADAMRRNPNVELAAPNRLWYPAQTFPTDPEFDRLWGLHNTGQDPHYVPEGYSSADPGTPDADVDAPEAFDAVPDTSGIVVAVIDTGVDISHPDLANQIWTNPGEVVNGVDDDGNGLVDDVHGWDFYEGNATVFDGHHQDDHGTHVAGTIAATWNNGLGVAGLSQAKIMPLKFLGPNGGSTADAIDALDYAIQKGAHVTNNSWGGGGYDEFLEAKIAEADAAGQLFVAAAGNGGSDGVGDDNDVTSHYPSNYALDNVVSVAATDADDELTGFSNYGDTTVDLGAPGAGIYSTVPQFAKVVTTDDSVAWFSAHLAFNLAGVLDAIDRQEVVAATLVEAGLDPVGLNVVVVDDDGGGTFEDAWETALTALGATVTVCTEGAGTGSASSRCGGSDHLDTYDLAVWTVGAEFSGTLTSTNIAELTDHLTMDHGALVIEGIDLGYDLSGDDPTVAIPFFEDVLRSRYVGDYDSNPRVEGAAGAFDGLLLELDPGITPEYNQFFADALTTMPGGVAMMRGLPYTWFSGTSMAAPHVTGAAAQVLAAAPTISVANLKGQLMNTGDSLAALAGKTVSGRRLNLDAALHGLVTPPTPDGLFWPYELTPSGVRPGAVAIGDVTGDGIADVVTRDAPGAGDWAVVVHPGTGSGLGPATNIATTYGRTVGIGDVNGDGRQDVVAGSWRGLEVFLQDSAGELVWPAVEYPFTSAEKLRVVDVDGDGLDDVVAIGWDEDVVATWIQDGGVLTGPVTTPVDLGGYNDLELADVSGDGLLDVVAMSGQTYAVPNLSILRGTGTGGWAAPETYDVVAGDVNTSGVGVGDVTGDGLADVVVTHGANGNGVASVLAQDGTGALAAPVDYPAGYSPQAVEVADVDNDSRADVVTISVGGDVSVLLQQPDGTLGTEQLYPSYDGLSSMRFDGHALAVGDVNSDGAPDLAIANTVEGLSVLRSTAPEAPAPSTPPDNDDIADAHAFTATDPYDFSSDIYDGGRAYDLTNASSEAGEPGAQPGAVPGRTVWFAWTAPADQDLRGYWTATPDALDEDVTVRAFRDVGAPRTTWHPGFADLELIDAAEVTGSDAEPAAASGVVAAGETVWIQVDSGDVPVGPGQFSTWAGPANDHFADAIDLQPAEAGSIDGTTNGATTEPGEPGTTGSDVQQTIWWTWTAPADGTAEFALQGDGPKLDVFTGSAVDALTPVVSEHALGATLASVETVVSQGDVLKVRGHQTGSGPLGLEWCLDDIHEPNDTHETATDLGAGGQVDGIICGDEDWFTITANAGETVTANLTWNPADGPMTIQLLDADGVTVLDEVVDATTGDESVSGQAAGDAYQLRISGSNAPYGVEVAGLSALQRVEEGDGSAFAFGSGWFGQENGSYSGGTARTTGQEGASVEVLFSGSAVRLFGLRAPNRGVMEVVLDGVLVDTVDTWSSGYVFGAELFAAYGLADGPHQLQVTFVGGGVSTASATYLTVDAVEME